MAKLRYAPVRSCVNARFFAGYLAGSLRLGNRAILRHLAGCAAGQAAQARLASLYPKSHRPARGDRPPQPLAAGRRLRAGGAHRRPHRPGERPRERRLHLPGRRAQARHRPARRHPATPARPSRRCRATGPSSAGSISVRPPAPSSRICARRGAGQGTSPAPSPAGSWRSGSTASSAAAAPPPSTSSARRSARSARPSGWRRRRGASAS